MAKRRRPDVCIAFLLLFIFSPIAHSLDVPERPKSYVNDYADMLTPDNEAELERALVRYERETTNQVVVATFPSLEGDSIEDFSIRLAEAWKVGQEGRDNGVIFLIFREDRKMRIEVGYGLEGVLTDARAIQIQQFVVTLFQAGRYEEGILLGTSRIVNATRGEFQAGGPEMASGRRPLTPAEQEALRQQARALGIGALIMVLIFFVIDFFRYRSYVTDHRLYRQRYSFWEWWFRFAILLFVLNILFRVLFYSMLFSRGGYYGGRSGFGGFRAGGGGFGGGGASSSW